MTFGVLSFFGCGLLGALLALYYAHHAEREIVLAGGRVRGTEHVALARGLAWANLGLGFVAALIWVAMNWSG